MIMMFIKAFVVGGLICVIGQLLIDLTKLTPAKILVLFVCLGVLLGGIGVYQPLVDFAGAGATVPLTGFGNALAKGVKEAIQRDGFLGVITGRIYRLCSRRYRCNAQRTYSCSYMQA